MNSFLIAWRASAWLPVSVVRASASALAWAAWARKAKPARRLEDNLHRVTGLEGKELRALSRKGMLSAARYYAETLELGRMSEEQVDARVRLADTPEVRELLAGDNGVVAVLSHTGNWDLVGAFASRNLIPVTAVAEKLEPVEVFEEFVELREGVGIHVLAHEGGSTFRELIAEVRGKRVLACLLADRDLSGSGVEVTMWGHKVKVAPGPAALAVATKAKLLPVMVHYERLHGAQRRAAGSRWGSVLTFGPILDPVDFDGDSRVEELSQVWAAWIADKISEHPQDWHMLQRFGWSE